MDRMNSDRPYRKALLPENAKLVFEGNIFDVYQWEQKLYDGTTATFEKLSRPDTVSVFPVLEDGTILLIEDSQPHRETILTTPSGRVEEGETPEVAAERELLEETGYRAERLEPLFSFAPEDKIDWMFYAFVGKNCTKVAEPKPDAGEKIVPKPVSFDELIALAAEKILRSGRGHEFAHLALSAKMDAQKMEELKKKFYD